MNLYKRLHILFFDFLAYLGLNVARSYDYYSVLPVRRQLRRTIRRWCRPSSMRGVDFPSIREMEEFIRPSFRYRNELPELREVEPLKEEGWGPGFPQLDAYLLYLFVRYCSPNKIVEVGSGVSTYYMHKALEKIGGDAEFYVIDPFPSSKILELEKINVIREEVQSLDPKFFSKLKSRDILFIDSTHVVKIDGDVPFLYLEVLPILEIGVYVHIHDIHFPYNVPYPPQRYVFDNKWPWFWTEAMILQAFLIYNDKFKIRFATSYLNQKNYSFLKNNLYCYSPLDPHNFDTHYSSLWLQRLK